MDDETATQLRLLREIRDALAGAGVRWWLYGGWAMDAHAGDVTRAHSDIEAFVWRDDANTAHEALTAAGFTPWPALHADEAQPFTKEGQEVGLWFLVRNERDEIVTRGRWSDWPWLTDAFDTPCAALADLEVPVMSLEGLLDIKTNFATHPHGAPLREKDIADIERLRTMIAERPRLA